MTDLHNLTDPLTDRELEILSLLVDGLSNREIAAQLHLAYDTIKFYNSQIYSKLGVNNRKNAIASAETLGLLDTTGDKPQSTSKHNLPESVTEFVGRKQEIHELVQLIEIKRLITILAPGGMGKTRLSLAVAKMQIGLYTDGVFFVPLAPLSTPNDIVTTIAENIAFVFHGENPPAHQLAHFLKDRNMLLVLDNFEHLLDGAGLVSDIIASTANIRIIVTSRERLNLRGENVYSLRGLEFPTWETPADALEYDAVKLFVQSANRARADFELSPGDLNFLARICRLTEGMPLGIELAAGWVDLLSLEKIAAEIQRGLDILETEHRDVPERHRSVLATFNYTWERLEPTQQAIFMKLSVFRGGFTVEAAESIAGANLRQLRKLANKSLIQPLPNDRYNIHELLRQFGAGKLEASGELVAIQATHATFYADFLHQRTPDIKGRRQLEGLNEIEADFDNIRVAWEFAIEQVDYQLLDQMAEALILFCEMRGHRQEGIVMSSHVLNIVPDKADHANYIRWNRLRARHAQLWLSFQNPGSANRVRDDIERSLAYARGQQDESTVILCEWLLGMTFQYQIDEQTQLVIAINSLPMLQRALENDFSEDDLYYRCRILLSIERTMVTTSTPWHDIEPYFRERLALTEHLDDQWSLTQIYAHGAFRYIQTGDWEANIDSWQQALTISRKYGSLTNISGAAGFLALYTFESGDFVSASILADEAYQIAYDSNNIHPIGRASIAMTAIELVTTDSVSDMWLERLKSAYNRGAQMYWVPYTEWLFALVAWHTGDIETASQHLYKSLDIFKYLYRVPETIMCLPIAAFILSDQGQPEWAVELINRALSEHRLKSGWMHEWSRLDQLRADLQRELGATAYQTAWERGKQLDMETVVDELLEVFSEA